MAENDVDQGERLRDELDELHERLAALTARVGALECDRDALYAEAETQADLMQRAEARIRRYRLSVRKIMGRASSPSQGETPTTEPPMPE